MYDFISLSALSLDEVLALTSRIFKQESTSPQLVFLVELGFGDGSFCGGRKTGKPGEKPRNKARANNKLNPHKVTPGRNGTWATVVEGNRSHHFGIPTLQILQSWGLCFGITLALST